MSIVLKSAVVVGVLAFASTQLVANRQVIIAWLRPAASEAPKISHALASQNSGAPGGGSVKTAPATPAQISGIERIFRDRSGHYYADVYINGALIHGMIDTGATAIALTDADARRIGLAMQDKDYSITTNTANGVSNVAPIELKTVRLGSITVNNIRAVVTKPDALKVTLIGMSFLNRMKSFEVSENNLILRQ